MGCHFGVNSLSDRRQGFSPLSAHPGKSRGGLFLRVYIYFMQFRQWLVENVYKSGMCDAFAVALHRKFNWPLAVIRGYYEWDDEEYFEDAHAVAIPSRGQVADCVGIRPQSEAIDSCFFSNPITRKELVLVSEKEMMGLFTMEGVSEADIVQALKHIESHPAYKKNSSVNKYSND
jgi:hypothetical protein